MDTALLKRQLELEEARRQFPYTDTTGHLSIGVGRNLTAVGLRSNEIDYLLNNDILEVTHHLDTYLPWWRGLDDCRQRALADLCFNMGIHTLLTFHKTLGLLLAREFEAAAAELARSTWFTQVGDRGPRIAAMVRTGSDGWLYHVG